LWRNWPITSITRSDVIRAVKALASRAPTAA
jgi:hypothetical protein